MSSPVPNRIFKKHFFILYELAELGCCFRRVKVSSTFLGRNIGLSQQTISRRLIELENKGLIERNITHEGTLIKISSSGVSALRKICSGLEKTLYPKILTSVILEGTVFSGLGEGAYYVTKRFYMKQFIEYLGFDPYPGTLNLKLSMEHILKVQRELESYPFIEIKGFKNKDRTYGNVRCYHALIDNKEKGAVLLALRSHYDRSVLEIIAPTHLRSHLNLEDGTKVRIEIFPTKILHNDNAD